MTLFRFGDILKILNRELTKNQNHSTIKEFQSSENQESFIFLEIEKLLAQNEKPNLLVFKRETSNKSNDFLKTAPLARKFQNSLSVLVQLHEKQSKIKSFTIHSQ